MNQVLLDAADMRRTLGRMAHEILEANGGTDDLVVVGILRRGWPIAKRLAFLMTQIEGTTVPCGKVDAKAFRDDRKGSFEDGVSLAPHPSSPRSQVLSQGERADETEIPFRLEGKRVILVDELIFTGRTIRASLDALVQHGRPSCVQLAVLLDRGHRELPIQPDYCGKTVATEKDDHIVVKVNEIDGEDAVELTGNGSR